MVEYQTEELYTVPPASVELPRDAPQEGQSQQLNKVIMTPQKSACCLYLQVVGKVRLGYKEAIMTHSVIKRCGGERGRNYVFVKQPYIALSRFIFWVFKQTVSCGTFCLIRWQVFSGRDLSFSQKTQRGSPLPMVTAPHTAFPSDHIFTLGQ